MDSKTYIILLHWNTTDDVINCIKSIFQSDYKHYEIILVDNGSTCESLKRLRDWTRSIESPKISDASNNQRWGDWCVPYSFSEIMQGKFPEINAAAIKCPSQANLPIMTVIENGENLGFAEGNNIGIRYALMRSDGEYIWLLNSDTTIEPDTLSKMIKVVKQDAHTKAVQSMLINFRERSKIDSVGIAISNDSVEDFFHGRELTDYYRDFGSTEYREVFGACAASALFRSEIFREIGLLDKRYFTIYEDVDLAFRIRIKGYNIYLAEHAIVYHKRGITAPQLPSQRASEFWRFIRKRSIIALKLKYWPLKYLLPSFQFYTIAIKAVILAVKRRVFIDTLIIWFYALKYRFSVKYDRTLMFKLWNTKKK